MNKKITLSIVSHGHAAYVARLLLQLAALKRSDFDVILTHNVPEVAPPGLETLPFPLRLVENVRPKGFGGNHNAAFAISGGEHFVILNPDIELIGDPFTALLALAESDPHCICAPLIVDGDGRVEDSARCFPSPYRLAKRLLCRILKRPIAPDPVPQQGDLLMPDWVAGMFLMVPRPTYALLGGFNDGFFLYFEDVDFGARARLAGCHILVNRAVAVIHRAQRDSHRRPRFMWWHVQSAFRFFRSATYFRIQWRSWSGRR
jgi:N-acetylglucosaminyl-diphospho-decaprenol L-rhamnosyltransferase